MLVSDVITYQPGKVTVRKYKSHRRVGGVSEVLEAIRLQEEHSAALVTF